MREASGPCGSLSLWHASLHLCVCMCVFVGLSEVFGRCLFCSYACLVLCRFCSTISCFRDVCFLLPARSCVQQCVCVCSFVFMPFMCLCFDCSGTLRTSISTNSSRRYWSLALVIWRQAEGANSGRIRRQFSRPVLVACCTGCFTLENVGGCPAATVLEFLQKHLKYQVSAYVRRLSSQYRSFA